MSAAPREKAAEGVWLNGKPWDGTPLPVGEWVTVEAIRRAAGATA